MVLFAALLVTAAGCQSDERPAATPHYGALMGEVGRRFELFGRAAQAGRWKLAEYELHELGEVFEELEHATPPAASGGLGLHTLTAEFAAAQLPELRASIREQDAAAFARAFASVADHCNDCHKSAHHEFIEIPRESGVAVPRLDPQPHA